MAVAAVGGAVTTTHPVLVGATQVHAVLDELLARPVHGADHHVAVAEWSRALTRIEALRLRLLAAADAEGVAAAKGMTGTDTWLARSTRSDRADAARTLRLAGALGGVGGDGGCPQTAAAVARGEVSTEHARVVVAALDRLPARVTAAQRTEIEASLVEQARSVDPARLRRLARRCLAAVEPDPVVVDADEESALLAEEAAATDRVRLTLHDETDGTVSGHFVVTAFAGAVLRRVVDAMTAPRRGRPGASEAQIGPSGRRLDRAHLAGQAFTELLEHLPTDHLHAKVAATVVVTVPHDRLLGALGAAGALATPDGSGPAPAPGVARTDTGTDLTAAQARRLACGAGLLPAVLGGASQVLDAGRTQRLFTQVQRTVLATRYETCAADGCGRPYAWCELHHRRPWAAGGRTDLSEAVPLCGFHHRRVHDRGYEHRFRPDGSLTFHRRT